MNAELGMRSLEKRYKSSSSFGSNSAFRILHSAFELVGRLGFAPSSRRLRAGTSLSKFATQMAVCKDRDAKAELNRPAKPVKSWPSPGSRRKKWNPKRTEADARPLIRPCGVSAGGPASLGKWTGMRVARPLFRFGRPACICQHLCPLVKLIGFS